jgi:hypothetical protein
VEVEHWLQIGPELLRLLGGCREHDFEPAFLVGVHLSQKLSRALAARLQPPSHGACASTSSATYSVP